jgi:hypothetical protein
MICIRELLQCFGRYLDSRRIVPQSFKVIESALFMIKYMHHDVVKIEQYPCAFRKSFGPARFDALGAQFIFDALSQGLDMTCGSSTQYNKKVGKRRHLPNIEDNDIFCFAVRCQLCAGEGKLFGIDGSILFF